MQRDEAFAILKQHLQNKNLRNHCLACEAVMRALARHFGEDEEAWGLAGLLHDLDYEQTKDDPARHSREGAGMLAELGLPAELCHAVLAHNGYHGVARDSLMDKALYATDPLTGFIVAAALIKPEKKLAAVDLPFMLKRFKEKSFARGADRGQMESCGEMGLDLEEFMNLGLKAMQEISAELDL